LSRRHATPRRNRHHLGHHQTYTTKLNAALSELRADSVNKALAKHGIDRLLTELELVPAKLRGAIRNHGGGYVNHELFWASMRAPREENAPGKGSRVGAKLAESFGSLDGFKAAFTTQALGVFGSGWAWLVLGQGGKLSIVTTPNQDTPAKDLAIVVGLDVWEHAYYLKHQSKRADYVEGWFKVVDWDTAELRLGKALAAASEDKAEL
jgi:Fe-Mn family superoxide dismutase